MSDEDSMQDHQIARRAMIDGQLRPEAVTDPAVLAAMAAVAREDHVPADARPFAYFDRSIPLPGGGAMMPPAALGRLLSALGPKRGERALLIGPATGYSAALLAHIGLDVTEARADALPGGTFDLVLVEGAVDELPEPFAQRVAPAGRVAVALADRGVSRLAVGSRAGKSIAFRTVSDADVAPLPGYERPMSFIF